MILGALVALLAMAVLFVGCDTGGGGGSGGGDKVATPAATPPAGEISAGTIVTLSCSTTDSTIYYTTDGSTPTTESLRYNPGGTGIMINTAMTIKAFAVANGMTDSDTLEAAYTISTPLTYEANLTGVWWQDDDMSSANNKKAVLVFYGDTKRYRLIMASNDDATGSYTYQDGYIQLDGDDGSSSSASGFYTSATYNGGFSTIGADATDMVIADIPGTWLFPGHYTRVSTSTTPSVSSLSGTSWNEISVLTIVPSSYKFVDTTSWEYYYNNNKRHPYNNSEICTYTFTDGRIEAILTLGDSFTTELNAQIFGDCLVARTNSGLVIYKLAQ
ncbi:MAG: chitobiase/beta-hexosaminidase C-terminal domain-containing protein [Spirochaetaceae bacterium]|nr:chitobiase/beta-hexosaminidase C-terminal domain-containing protein [Spirochaetaceae bacterium]